MGTAQRYQIHRETLDGLKTADGAPRFAALVVVDRDNGRIVGRGRMVECWDAAARLNRLHRLQSQAAQDENWTMHAFWSSRLAACVAGGAR